MDFAGAPVAAVGKVLCRGDLQAAVHRRDNEHIAEVREGGRIDVLALIIPGGSGDPHLYAAVPRRNDDQTAVQVVQRLHIIVKDIFHHLTGRDFSVGFKRHIDGGEVQ